VPNFFKESLGGQSGLFGNNETSEPALLFLHERTTPSGKPFLVAVRLHPDYHIGFNSNVTPGSEARVYWLTKNRRLVAEAWDYPAPPASAQQVSEWSVLLPLPDRERMIAEVPVRERSPDASAELIDVSGSSKNDPPVQIDYGNKLRVMAGQADPSDPSHFTIAYQLDGRGGTIDGWMKDAGVVLRPREGAAVADDQRVSSNLNEVWDLTATPAASQPVPQKPAPRRDGRRGGQ
jgi:hypothetical protein